MQSTGILCYMLLFGIGAGSIWIYVNKDESCKKNTVLYVIKSALFFFAGIYFLVSAVKLYLGEAQSTLIESFWDIKWKTYVHYGVILLAVSVIIPLLMKKFFALSGCRLVQTFDFVYIIVFVVYLFLTRRIDNQTYCILYGICLIISFGITYLYHKEIEYISKDDFKRHFLEILPWISTWVVMRGIYYPNELFINNIEDFTENYAQFFVITFVGSALMIAGLILLLLLFMPQKLLILISLVMAGLSCAGYLQAMFLNGKLTAMNGEEQVWSLSTLVLNGAMWSIILAAVVIGGYRHAVVRRICKGLCIYISLIQLVTLGWLLMTSDLERKNENAAMTKEGSLELSSGNNVLVFVLDNFDSAWFEAICQDDDSLLNPLADFTYYRNGTSQFAHTNPAIPYMLTGVEWSEENAENYFEDAYRENHYVERIAEAGTDVRIYTETNLISEDLCQKVGNYKDSVINQYHVGKTFCTMLQTSLYKTAPFVLKPLYEYYTSDIKEMAYNENIWSIDNDKQFYDDIIKNRLTISREYQSAFRFYHMRGPHAPFYLTEDLTYEPTGRGATRESQGKGSLKVVYTYMEQLKALGKYNDATIIITADHGQGEILGAEKNSGKPDKTSRTLFLIKRPEEHHESMIVSEAPVSQAELMPTILDAFGMEYSSYGRTFEEILVDERRIRSYIDIYGNYRVVYTIDGHAADIESWSIESAVYD